MREVEHFLRAVANDESVAPYGATFEDGYRALVVAEAMLRSADEGRRVRVEAASAALPS